VIQPEFAQAILLAAHDHRERPAQIGGGIDGLGRWRCCDCADFSLAQPGQHARAFLNHERHGKQHAGRCADDIRVENIGYRIAHDHRVATRGIRAA